MLSLLAAAAVATAATASAPVAPEGIPGGGNFGGRQVKFLGDGCDQALALLRCDGRKVEKICQGIGMAR